MSEAASSTLVGALRDDMRRLVLRGLATPIGTAGRLAFDTAVRARARADLGPYAGIVDSVLLQPLRSGERDGALITIAAGNYKDDACCIAAAAVTRAFHATFEGATLFDADLPTLLRRAMIVAHDAVWQLAEEPIGDVPSGTAAGSRKSLRGIGAAVIAAIVLPHSLVIAHVGDNRGYLLRAGEARRLTLDHTLEHDPAFRAQFSDDELSSLPKDIVLRVLGLTREVPAFDVSRVDLLPGDRVVLANGGLTDSIANELVSERAGDVDAAIELGSKRLSEACRGPSPTLALVDARSSASES